MQPTLPPIVVRAVVLGLPGLAATVALAALPGHARAAENDCSNVASQEYLLHGDPYNLDADDDGFAREDLPSGGGGGEGGGRGSIKPAVPPPPPKLSKPAARNAAKRKARAYLRRSARVSSLAFNGCGRDVGLSHGGFEPGWT